MADNSTVVNLGSLNSVPGSLYQQVAEERDYLKEFIGSATVDKIQALEEQVSRLLADNNNLQGQVDSFEAWRNSLLEQAKHYKEACDIKIAEATKAHNDGRERQRGKWEADIRALNNELNKVRAELVSKDTELAEVRAELVNKDTELSNVRAELDKELIKVSLLEGIDTKVGNIDNKVTDILATVFKIIDILNNSNGISKEDLVASVKDEVAKVADKLSIVDECNIIRQLEIEGKTDREIADYLWPTLGRRYSKLVERKSRVEYTRLIK